MTANPALLYLRRAALNPTGIAIHGEDLKLTFADLAQIVTGFAAHMQLEGIRPGSIVAVHTNDNSVIIGTAFACALVGATWVFGDEALRRSQDIRPTHRLYTRDVTAEKGAVLVDEQWLRPPEGLTPAYQGFATPDDTWLLFHSSGTTGTPKFMALSCEVQARRIMALDGEFVSGKSQCVFLFAAPSPPALMRALAALCWGAGLVVSTDPHFWQEAGVTHVFASPQQIKYVMSGQKMPRKFGKALIGGDGMPDELASDLLENFERVVNTYGATETNLVVENEKIRAKDGSIQTRTIWYDSEVEIVDEDNRVLPAGQEGIVRIRNPYLVSGYLGMEASHQSSIRDGWFYPGDKGTLTPERNFLVTGRYNDRLVVGGVKVNAVLLDYLINSVEGVEDAISFQLENIDGANELVVFVKIGKGEIHSDVQSNIRIKIASSMGISAIPSKFIFTDDIPRTENGKPNRRLCAQMAMQARREGGLATR